MEDPESHLHLYKKLSEISRQPSMLNNNLKYGHTSTQVFSYLRYEVNSLPSLVVIHFGTESASEDFSQTAGAGQGIVALYVKADPDQKPQEMLKEGNTVDITYITLYPGDALIVNLY